MSVNTCLGESRPDKLDPLLPAFLGALRALLEHDARIKGNKRTLQNGSRVRRIGEKNQLGGQRLRSGDIAEFIADPQTEVPLVVVPSRAVPAVVTWWSPGQAIHDD